MESNQSNPNSPTTGSLRPVAKACDAFAADGAASSRATANASPRSSGGVAGSESSSYGTKNVTANPVSSVTTPVKPGFINLSNLSVTITSSTTLPPSPPALTATGVAAVPLTLANVAAIPSSLSTVSSGTASSPSDSVSELSFSSSSAASSVVSEAGEQLLERLFGPAHLADFARHGVKVGGVPTSDEATFEGVTLESQQNNGAKTLYCVSNNVEELSREGLVDLMELADEELDCTALVICLEKKKLNKAILSETLHSLMYVGGQIVPQDSGLIKYNNKEFVLVGLDL